MGFYAPDGEWMTESDWDSPEAAAKRVNYLNGGTGAAYEILDALPEVDNDLLNEVLQLATANAHLAKNHADDLLYYATRDSAAEGE